MEGSLENGFYWFIGHRSSYMVICQLMDNQWYTFNEIGPISMEEISRRGWILFSKVENPIIE